MSMHEPVPEPPRRRAAAPPRAATATRRLRAGVGPATPSKGASLAVLASLAGRASHAPLKSLAVLASVAGLALAGASAAGAAAQPIVAHLGKPLTPQQAARGSLNVFPDGRGLPPGQGSAAQGAALYASRCAACHGPNGRGASAEELAGGSEPLTSATPDKTIGLYWPYATTIFDFTRRAMPMNAPGSLSADEVYAITAYLLFANGLIGEAEVMDAATLPKVRMPNRDGFIGIDAPMPR